MHNRTELLPLLLAAGADVERRSADAGRGTPLHGQRTLSATMWSVRMPGPVAAKRRGQSTLPGQPQLANPFSPQRQPRLRPPRGFLRLLAAE